MQKELKLKTLKKNFAKPNKLLHKQLLAYNISKIGKISKKHLGLFYYNGKKLVAGLYACQALGVFYIDLLWVDKSYRNKNLGSKLLEIAEEQAIKNKAMYIRLNTGSFQAPKFYLKRGYELFAKLPLITKTKKKHYDYYFVKYLLAETCLQKKILIRKSQKNNYENI